MARTTAARAKKAMSNRPARKPTAYVGDSARRIPGSAAMPAAPATPMVRNHSVITGPNSLFITWRRSSADGGEVDGVRLLSPRTIELIFDQQSDGIDLAVGLPARLGIGYGLPHPDWCDLRRKAARGLADVRHRLDDPTGSTGSSSVSHGQPGTVAA